VTSKSNQDNARNPDFLVFSDDWGEHPSSCQHIFRHIAKNHRVLWVNTIGMRNPTLSWTDARKVVVKASKMFGKKRESANEANTENLTVCQPFMLPGSRSRAVRRFNARSVAGKVQTLLDRLDIHDPVVVATVPNASEYPELLEGRKTIYYCVDDFSLWPGLDADGVREMEARLIERANSIIAVSDTLFHRLAKYGKPTHLLTHGVDLEMFSIPATSEHALIEKIAKPRVGFFGLIDGRMNWDLIEPLARRMPKVSFVFAGPADATAGELPRVHNIHYVGNINYHDLPRFIAGVESLILPYRTGELSESISPLKLKEYVATGKPVVSTPIAEARRWSDVIWNASTVAEWVMALNSVVGQAPNHHRLVDDQRLSQESWKHKADEFLEICG
jgi:glycosyltransferase involved in cell wall biosynthesis